MPDPGLASRLRLFVSDLDGTLIYEHPDGGSRATERMGQALRSLQQRGVRVCLASGRIHQAMQHIAEDLGVEGPIISCNGAQVWEPGAPGDGIVHHQPLALDVASELVAYCADQQLQLNYYLPEGIYAHRFEPYWDIYHGRTSAPMHAVDRLHPLLDRPPTKLLIFSEARKILALRDYWAPRLQGRANVLITADEYLEFMHPGVNKGLAVKMVMERMGLEAGAVLAAGDSYNDMEMVQMAGFGLAVRNGREALKQAADHIIEPPQESGLADFIEEHLLG